ncbi:SDR family NAD(P)-dependent oxidoreductase [Geodermatophilus marinus]|uniref:SDR family NAD(P)-dependent oxidoreductase n=1 Tax=Geodermatophilus sp. LHW52908 TaxID=2303986 RepID=UPI000E3CB3EA|nr:SDR family NAD(P)-dependent oxidoreductase [Geodermatophilus sp. LHW52908]RFU18869.1 SDR family NAD(P)-dependent oxidoreductase [Geodermatophilus sp. LHW52908]
MTDQRPLALVTGASSGIGLELARQFAGAGFDLVLNAEDDELTAAADALRVGGTTVTPVRADLRAIAGVEAVWSAVQATGRPLAAAALNAGVGRGGAFVDDDLETQMEVIDLDVVSTVRLAHHVLRDMVARGEGRVLITSSVAATMPGAFQAVYNASKSFLQSFAEALVEELAGTGVTVTSLMPGPTDTEFFDRAQLQDTRVGSGSKDDPAQVAEQGFTALMRGEQKVFAGSLLSRVQAVAAGLIPDRLKAKAHRQMAEPGSGG